jgi:hypothetical protein
MKFVNKKMQTNIMLRDNFQDSLDFFYNEYLEYFPMENDDM